MINKKKIAAIKKGKPFKWFDFVVMGALIVLIVLLLVFMVYREKGAYLCIHSNQQKAYYDLSKDQTIAVDGHLTVKIQDGYAWVLKSDCPDHYCEKYGKIRYTGQSIVCAPNRILITIVSDQSEDPGWIITGVLTKGVMA